MSHAFFPLSLLITNVSHDTTLTMQCKLRLKYRCLLLLRCIWQVELTLFATQFAFIFLQKLLIRKPKNRKHERQKFFRLFSLECWHPEKTELKVLLCSKSNEACIFLSLSYIQMSHTTRSWRCIVSCVYGAMFFFSFL